MRYLKHACVLGVALVTTLITATAAFAGPAPGYERFADCPDKTVDPDVHECFTSVVNGGHLKLGSKNTPISDPITLTLGTNVQGEVIFADLDGGRQLVPGGLIGLSGLDWLSWLFPFSLLSVHAEAELAGTPNNPVTSLLSGQPFTLPLRIKLDNTLFTSNCYIGSSDNPVELELTTGTTAPPAPNEPITGQFPTLDFDTESEILTMSDGILVDNAFSVPKAKGCGLLNLGLIDGLVNLQSGLPSPAGKNEAVQEIEAAAAAVEAIFPPNGIDQ